MFRWLLIFIAPLLILSGCDESPIVFTVNSKDYSKPLDVKKYRICQNTLQNCSTNFQILISPNNDHYIISNAKNSKNLTILINEKNIISYKASGGNLRYDIVEKIIFLLIGFLISMFTTAMNWFFIEKVKLLKNRRNILNLIVGKNISNTKYWKEQLEKFTVQIIDVDTMASRISAKYEEISEHNYSHAKKRKIFKPIVVEQVCN